MLTYNFLTHSPIETNDKFDLLNLLLLIVFHGEWKLIIKKKYFDHNEFNTKKIKENKSIYIYIKHTHTYILLTFIIIGLVKNSKNQTNRNSNSQAITQHSIMIYPLTKYNSSAKNHPK